MNITSKWKYAAGLMLATVALLSTRTASADDLTSKFSLDLRVGDYKIEL